MGGYLPQVFERFGSDYPAVMEAFREPRGAPARSRAPLGEGAQAGEARDRDRQ